MEGQARVRALRGATTIAADDREAIVAATAELLQDMMERNGVAPEDLISILFTATEDITAEFPALAARRLSISDTPLMCARELGVTAGLPRCVRVLMHLYTTRPASELRHVYLGAARSLRADLPG